MTTSNVERTTFDRLGEAIIETRGGCERRVWDAGCQEEPEPQLQMGGHSHSLPVLDKPVGPTCPRLFADSRGWRFACQLQIGIIGLGIIMAFGIFGPKQDISTRSTGLRPLGMLGPPGKLRRAGYSCRAVAKTGRGFPRLKSCAGNCPTLQPPAACKYVSWSTATAHFPHNRPSFLPPVVAFTYPTQ